MSTMNELFSDIENALDVSNLVADGQTDASNYRHTAQEALAVLRQRVADLETFYQHMIGGDYQNDLLDILKDDMFAARNFNISNGGSGIVLETDVWADYDALLERLKANGE